MYFGSRQFSLRITLFSALLATVLFTTLINALMSSMHVKNIIMQTIRENLYIAVGIGAQQIDGDVHSKIRNSDDENSEEYKSIFQQLDKIRRINPDIKNVYTIRQNASSSAVFIVDADPKIKERARIGHRVIQLTPAIREAFAFRNRIVVENTFFSDEWGTFVSGFAPFYNAAGTFEGLLGIDVMAETVKLHQINNIAHIIMTSLVVGIVALILSLILSREISNPVSAVTNDMRQIQDFNLETELAPGSIIREIRTMTDALENMKKGLRSFKKYVPTELVSDLIILKKEASLEVEKRLITILFSDIEGFTTISEKISPEDLAESIGMYFGAMTGEIMNTGGIVDKYIGDAIMALWGTPRQLPDHPIAACKAALACRRREMEINEILNKKGLPPFFTRFGINTGEALVGNIGFDKRISYTAIGDNVNLAARLEGVNKLYNTGILINESTNDLVKDQMLTRFIDTVIVKGKTCGTRIFELISCRSEASDKLTERTERYNAGMEKYIDHRWNEALTIFNSLKNAEADPPLQLIIERCQNFASNPPGKDFVGVVSLRTK